MKYNIPADVDKNRVSQYKKNLKEATNGTNHLMLFAGDQKVEHLNNDFYGKDIPLEDNSPEHMFKIASSAKIGVFATQFGLISRYGRDYKNVPYLVKLNSKTNLIPYDKQDPYSQSWISVGDVVNFAKESGLDIKGVGYTLYLGGEHEHSMLSEAAKIVHEAHKNGLLAVLWIYPKGKFVKDEHDGHLIAGAAGVGAALGADFVKLKVPYDKEGKFDSKLLREATMAAGRTGMLCEGGAKIDEKVFLTELYAQIHKGGSRGNGTGRNIHQRPLKEAVKMANAIYAITSENATVKEALKLLK
ncbi:aldolase [Sulfurimonas autotrophica]|uniref:fructose-bisphosphate aldolase n=1 Tax=Sulfurimonas autotrophica (strain ATCC BAA-671 / DSM 16294 / JCM 11897 / OK10) TaxID=563040 RepID=E0UV00_SULAO|nr:aldolase [Sulfurimonas autotrophica]ADN08512.1 fructose-bisphosphate aldolase [Sulfurimonas autotrophica DSM 16294]